MAASVTSQKLAAAEPAKAILVSVGVDVARAKKKRPVHAAWHGLEGL
jgi:hypothetical protein